MQTYQQAHISLPRERNVNSFFVTRFLNWCGAQEEGRFGWTAAIIAVLGCALTPCTVLAIVVTGNSVILFTLTAFAMVASMTVNLAAMPTRITIPVFLLSVLVHVAILAACVYQAF